MKRLILILSLFCLMGCSIFKKTPPSTANSDAAAVGVTTARTEVMDRAGGVNSAIGFTANTLPDSRAKEVINSFVDEQYRLLGHPKVETQTSFEKAAAQLLSNDAAIRALGDTAKMALSLDNQKLKDGLKTQEEKFNKAREQEKAEHAAEVERVRLEGELAQKKLVSYIFFGGSALLAAAGVVVLVTASSVPMFGPKVAFGLFGASALAGVMGITILQLMKELDKHPSILWIGSGTIVALLVGAGAIAYANHQHHVDSKNGTA